jgi:DNA polymerase
MIEVFCDCETFSEVELKGPQGVGGLVYSHHPSTEVLMWTFYVPGWREPIAVENCPDLWSAWVTARRLAHDVHRDGGHVFVHWGAFDRFIAEAFALPGSPFEQRPFLRDEYPQGIFYDGDIALFDLRQHCLQAGGPAALEDAAEWVGALSKLKGEAGIERFSKPGKDGLRVFPEDHPGEWHSFVNYGKRDAKALHPIAEHLGAVGGSPKAQEGWRVVERMNARGFPIDVPSVTKAREILEKLEPGLVEECQNLTGGLKPTQTKKLAKFWGLPNSQKATLEEYVKREDIPEPWRRSALIRLETSGATRHKLTPMLLRRSADDRVRYQFTFFGAWTGRLTAQGTQPQNFYGGRPDEEFFRALDWQSKDPAVGFQSRDWFEDTKKNIRGFIQAPPGRLLVSADLSQIELRVMAWQAGEDWILEALQDGTDIYRVTGAAIYGKPAEDLDHDTERYIAKRVELASQFGLSGTGRDGEGGLYARLKADGVKGFGRARSQHAIEAYRRTHPSIVQFWEDMGNGLIKAVRGEDNQVGPHYFEKTRDDLVRLIRPSGNYQCFWSPKLRASEWGNVEVSYLGRLKNGRMGRVGTYGARVAQGATQGTAADILIDAMNAAESEGYPPIMSIHDEIVTEIKDDGRDHVDNLCRIFTSQRAAYAEEIPIEAEGWQGRRFRK